MAAKSIIDDFTLGDQATQDEHQAESGTSNAKRYPTLSLSNSRHPAYQNFVSRQCAHRVCRYLGLSESKKLICPGAGSVPFLTALPPDALGAGGRSILTPEPEPGG